jgi:hypothetical protein
LAIFIFLSFFYLTPDNFGLPSQMAEGVYYDLLAACLLDSLPVNFLIRCLSYRDFQPFRAEGALRTVGLNR